MRRVMQDDGVLNKPSVLLSGVICIFGVRAVSYTDTERKMTNVSDTNGELQRLRSIRCVSVGYILVARDEEAN